MYEVLGPRIWFGHHTGSRMKLPAQAGRRCPINAAANRVRKIIDRPHAGVVKVVDGYRSTNVGVSAFSVAMLVTSIGQDLQAAGNLVLDEFLNSLSATAGLLIQHP